MTKEKLNEKVERKIRRIAKNLAWRYCYNNASDVDAIENRLTEAALRAMRQYRGEEAAR